MHNLLKNTFFTCMVFLIHPASQGNPVSLKNALVRYIENRHDSSSFFKIHVGIITGGITSLLAITYAQGLNKQLSLKKDKDKDALELLYHKIVKKLAGVDSVLGPSVLNMAMFYLCAKASIYLL